MSNCKLEKGYKLVDCKDIAGIARFYISSEFDKSDNSLYEFDADGKVTGIDQGSPTDSQTYFSFEVENQTGEFIQTIETDNVNQAVFVNQTVTLQLYDLKQDLVDILDKLIRGRFNIIVEDNRGRYFFVGITSGTQSENGEIGVGTAYTDLNGGTLTMIAMERRFAPEVDWASFSTDDGVEIDPEYP